MLKSIFILIGMASMTTFMWVLLYMTSMGPALMIMISMFIMCNQLSLISWLIILLWGGSVLLVMIISCTLGMMDYLNINYILMLIFTITGISAFVKWQNVMNSYGMINSSAMIYCMMVISITCFCISVIKMK